jgi:hypothetical protein
MMMMMSLRPPHDARRTQDAGRRTQDAGRRTQDAGRRTQDAGRRTQDAGRRTDPLWRHPVVRHCCPAGSCRRRRRRPSLPSLHCCERVWGWGEIGVEFYPLSRDGKFFSSTRFSMAQISVRISVIGCHFLSPTLQKFFFIQIMYWK